MKNKNICKFITESASENIMIDCFIYESNTDAMTMKKKLTYNRAILIKQGKGQFVTDGDKLAFESGYLIFAFKNENIYVLPEGDCEYMYIDFDGLRADELFKRFYITRNNRCFQGFDGLIPLWHDSLSRASDISIDLASESILLYTFSRFSSHKDVRGDLINRIIEITEENYTLPELSVSTVANELSYNTKYISHIFKEKMGISYSEYLRNLRIKYAVSLLEHGIDSVKNVAFLSGFSDPLYFSTVFKKVVGVSPSEYEKRNEKK